MTSLSSCSQSCCCTSGYHASASHLYTLIDSVFRCDVCGPLVYAEEPQLAPPSGSHGGTSQSVEYCCLHAALRAGFPLDFPSDLLLLVHMYLLSNTVSCTFLTTPPQPSQGLVQCLVRKVHGQYQLFLEMNTQPDFIRLRTALNQHKQQTHMQQSQQLPVNAISTSNTSSDEVPENREKHEYYRRCRSGNAVTRMWQQHSEDILLAGKDIPLLFAQQYNGLLCNRIVIGRDVNDIRKGTSSVHSLAQIQTDFRRKQFTCKYNDSRQHEVVVVRRGVFETTRNPLHLQIVLPKHNFATSTSAALCAGRNVWKQHRYEELTECVDRTVHVYENAKPQWNDNLQALILSFADNRVRETSILNFKVVRTTPESNTENRSKTKMTTILQFGRVHDQNTFILDFAFPFSPLTAFSVCLSVLSGTKPGD